MTPAPSSRRWISGRSDRPSRADGSSTSRCRLQRPHTFYAASASGGLWKTDEQRPDVRAALREREGLLDRRHRRGRLRSRRPLAGLGRSQQLPLDLLGRRRLPVGRRRARPGRTWASRIPTTSAASSSTRPIPRPSTSRPWAISIRENPERGVYKTTDGGKTWTKVLDVAVDGRAVGAVDLVMDPSDPETLYAAAYDRFRRPWTFGHRRPGLAASTRRSTAARPGPSSTSGLPGGILGRIGLAVYRQEPADPLRRASRTPTSRACPPRTASKEILEGKSSAGMIDGEVYRSDDAGDDLDQGQPGEADPIGGEPGLLLRPDRRRPERRRTSSTS
ncbi:MAG: hypothetical protein M0C28_39490 [Candidatus Moduliflexus flocculans]|nr:hypothetical protein [Candidatus Moduliflexus flocculans]